LSFLTADRIEQKMNTSTAENPVQWLFLDLNAFFASCKQQEAPALRGKPASTTVYGRCTIGFGLLPPEVRGFT
jgi:hypothetical protein